MSSAKTERLLNLVICLLSTRRPLSKAQIRSAVPQYGESTSMEAFERMFERDKDELRDLGIPLATDPRRRAVRRRGGLPDRPDAYALPEMSFEPDEMTVLGLASRVWQQASLAGPAARALTKLKAAGVEPDEASLIGLEPRVRTSEPAFEPLWAAVRDRVPVRFPYRRSGSAELHRAARRAVGGRQLARPLVPHRPRPRPAGRPGLPALPDHRGGASPTASPAAYDVPAGHDARAMLRSLVAERDLQPSVLRVRAGAGHILAPARVKEVLVDDEEQQATIIVPDGELSLAIGREGQNARLAAKLTGWRVDIKSESEFLARVRRGLRGRVQPRQVPRGPRLPGEAHEGDAQGGPRVDQRHRRPPLRAPRGPEDVVAVDGENV